MSGETPENNSPPGDGEKVTDSPAYETALDQSKLLDRIKLNYMDGVGAMEENRRLHSEDLNFVYNSESMGQWDPVVLEARRGKPCYTFNRVIGPVNLVIADMRQTRPAIKYRPVRGGSQPIADTFAGLWRSVEQSSRADQIYKTQYKFAVAGGYGGWYLTPEYAGDDTFDQVLRLKDIPNPQTLILDPEVNDPCGGDAQWGMVADMISRTKHEVLYEGFDLSSFSVSRDSYGWFTDKEVRVVNYYEKIPFDKTIALLDSGDTIDYTEKERAVEKYLEEHQEVKMARVLRTRKVKHWRVMWCKANGGAILEGPIFYNWKRVPLVRVPGRYINIEGRKKLQSLVRHSKDAQRSYNSRGSDMIERSALTPKAPYLVTETMIKGYEQVWAQANTASRPYLPYNIDPKAAAAGVPGGAPERTPPIDVPTAALALAQQALSDIQATIGYFDPALGNAEDMNRVSGKALVQHTRRSDLSSFEFIDGFGAALQLTAEMFVDMAKTVYDTARVERIIGIDGTEELAKLNHEGPNGDIINNLKDGEYDCTVTLGPSYQTQRQENLATMIDLAATLPAVQQYIPDLIVKNIDSQDSDEMTRRMRIPLINQGIVTPTEQERQNPPPKPPPNPLQQAELARAQALADKDRANATVAQSKAGSAETEGHKLIFETAGKHLANLIMAQKLGLNAQQAEAESRNTA